MPADLRNPFNPSCCEGSSCEHESAQVCGCDPGAGWVCLGHQQGLWEKEVSPKAEHEQAGIYNNPLEKHLKEVVNKTWNYAGRCKDWRDEVLNAILGLGGEAGEIVDEHKKFFFHKEKDEMRKENIKLELGDLCYYLAKMLDLYGLTLEEVLKANREKLFERHGIKE